MILCRRNATEALKAAHDILTRIGLTLNETKTRVCRAPSEPFDFLGYRFGVQYLFGSGRPYMAAFPAEKSVRRLKETLRRMIGTHMPWQGEAEMVRDVNRVVRGWMNYFSYGTLWKAYVRVDHFLLERMRGWLVHKHRTGSRGECRFPLKYMHETLGLVPVCARLSPSRMPSGRT